MNKLSTNALKTMITAWLSKPEIRVDLKHHSDIEDPDSIIKDWTEGNKEITRMAWELKMWSAPGQVKTPEQLEEYVWSLWCDGSRWKREEKHKLKDQWEDYFACGPSSWTGFGREAKCTHTAGFCIDMLGEENKDLVAKYFNDPAQAEKCILRVFVPDNQLADNYRLEVVTTPDDSEVVGWTVIVD